MGLSGGVTLRCLLRCETVDGHRRYADEPETPRWYPGPGEPASTSPYESGVHERRSTAFRLPEQRANDPDYTGYDQSDPLNTTGRGFGGEDSGGRIPVRGPEYPTIRPAEPAPAASFTTYPAAATTPHPAAPPTTTYPPGTPTTYPATAAAPATYPAATTSSPYGSSSPSSAIPATTEPTGAVPPVASRFGDAPEPVYRSRRPISAVIIAVVSALLMVPVLLLLVQVTFVDDPGVRGVVPAVLLTLGLPLTGIGLYAVAAHNGPGDRAVWLRPPVVYLPVGLLLLLAAGLAVA